MRRLTKSEFVSKAKKIHGDFYDYSKVDYKNAHIKVIIICPKHGEFLQRPNDHLDGHKCSVCSGHKSNLFKFISKAQSRHYNLYDYSKVDYKNNCTKVIIICKIHGEFNQFPSDHLKGHGCPICKISHKEQEITNYLINKLISFEYQKKFETCLSPIGNSLKFDFYLPNYKLLLEYDGEFHFSKLYNNHNFELTRKYDKIKNKWAKENNYKLIRLNYKQNLIKELEKIIK